MHKSIKAAACSLTLMLAACDVYNDDQIVTSQGPEFDLLLTPVGKVAFPNSCSAEAAPLVERGVALIHHMMYEEAGFVFSIADDADPDCAMAYWGQAMTIIHPLWPDVSSPKAIERGRSLVKKIDAMGPQSDRESKYIKTIKDYFEADMEVTEPQRLKLFENAWQNLSEDYPEDMEARAFYSLSLIATAGIGEDTQIQRQKAGSMSEDILATNPTHPGAHHYVIHAYDSPALAYMALPTANNYGALTPRVPHATHMMTHTFTRLGLWDKAIEWNSISAETALAICIETGEVNLHYTHALDYLAYAHLQKGDDSAVMEVLADADELKAPYSELTREGSAYALAALPARYALERRDWQAAAALVPRMPADFPWIDSYDQFVAITHFTRAIAFSRLGRPADAQADIDELNRMRLSVAEYSPYWAMQVEIQTDAARAWQTYAAGEINAGLAQMKQAAALEASTDKHAVTPGEVLPSAELYGDMLLEENKFDEALAAYKIALTRSPGRFNSLYGAAKASAGLGESAAARQYFSQIVKNTENSNSSRAQVTEAKAYLNGA